MNREIPPKKCSVCGMDQTLENSHTIKNRQGLVYFHSYCKKCFRIYKRGWRIKHSEQISNEHKTYRENHRDRCIAATKEWRSKNPGYRTKYLNKYPQAKISARLRTRIYQELKKIGATKSNSLQTIIGCDVDIFRTYIDTLFITGMSWDNYGEWHIDHIRPCDSFDLTDPEQQKQCFHYTNLQPLWAKDNLRKGAKY